MLFLFVYFFCCCCWMARQFVLATLAPPPFFFCATNPVTGWSANYAGGPSSSNCSRACPTGNNVPATRGRRFVFMNVTFTCLWMHHPLLLSLPRISFHQQGPRTSLWLQLIKLRNVCLCCVSQMAKLLCYWVLNGKQTNKQKKKPKHS